MAVEHTHKDGRGQQSYNISINKKAFAKVLNHYFNDWTLDQLLNLNLCQPFSNHHNFFIIIYIYYIEKKICIKNKIH